jgi:hypothetical protein
MIRHVSLSSTNHCQMGSTHGSLSLLFMIEGDGSWHLVRHVHKARTSPIVVVEIQGLGFYSLKVLNPRPSKR